LKVNFTPHGPRTIDLGERERTTAEIVRLANAMGWHVVDGRIVDRRR